MDNNNPADHRDNLAVGTCQHGSSEYEPTPDALIVGAYYRYLDQGSIPGHALKHWLDAERMLEDDRRLDRRVT